MVRNFEISGKFSIDLDDITMVTHDTESKIVKLTWKSGRVDTELKDVTAEEFEKLQAALNGRS